ncbi:MAG: hypothetical protein O3B82_00685 [Bacteroidetes bacterium]|nr:hypothetical protein [Bacteroidota bacterium]
METTTIRYFLRTAPLKRFAGFYPVFGKEGIDSLSVPPDSLLKTLKAIENQE